MGTGSIYSVKDAPRLPPQRLPRKIALLYSLRAGAHRRSQSARSAILAGWCPTSSGPAALRDVPVPGAAFFLATHLLARDMQPACLRAVAKREACTHYSELNVNKQQARMMLGYLDCACNLLGVAFACWATCRQWIIPTTSMQQVMKVHRMPQVPVWT